MILYEIKDKTAIIRLNRPEKRNALNPELVIELKEAFKKAETDEAISSVIITGEGKAFCAGADLDYLNKLKSYNSIINEKDSQSLADLFLQIYNFEKPVIAAVNGPAIAGGCGLATVCDFIVAHPSESMFGYSEVKIGFIPAIVSIFLINRVGTGIAKEMMLTGDYYTGQKAFEKKLVNYLDNNVLQHSIDLSSRLNSNSSQSLKLTKKMLNTVSGLTVDEAVKYCVRLNALSRSTEDFKTGLEKFLSKV